MEKKIFTTMAAALMSAAALAQAPAFPGAEGHGRYVTGGRGGKVVHVTNLNDSGTGSFREAVKSGKRIIVFDVAGVIALKSDLKFADNITILGQTAPSPGITLRYYTVQPGNNNIIRFLRIRRGEEKNINDGADATWQRNKTGIIDKVSDVNGYTEANFSTGSRPADFDTDKDGIPDAWEITNGLDPNDASDALTYSLDSKEYYTNLEVYANSLVEDIMKQGNADAESKVDEYYPAWKNPTGILQIITSNPSELAEVKYYSLNGTLLSAPQKGINIRKMLFQNGKTVVDKVIKE